jgi:branched-chain amino acid transport system substrate-binding protein
MQTPGNVLYNGYMATKALLTAVEKAGTTNNIAVIKELEKLKLTAEERMQHFDAYMNPKTHQMQQTIYLATSNDEEPWKADPNKLFKVLSWIDPEEAMDTDAEGACQMESYEDTPVYEP